MADGGARGRRCPRVVGVGRGGGSFGRQGDHLHAGQGPGPVRGRAAGGPTGPAQERRDRRGRSVGQVRCRPDVHPRLVGTGGRLRRRVSRTDGVGQAVRIGRSGS